MKRLRRLRRLAIKSKSIRLPRAGRMLATPAKFAKIFSTTSEYYRIAERLEKEHGDIPRHVLRDLLQKWAKALLGVIDIRIEQIGQPVSDRPMLFVGNHLSYLDIPLVMACVPVVFVSKAEVKKWLVIGPASRRAGTVFVQRESAKSRLSAGTEIANAIRENGHSVAIFPAGTTTVDEHKPWRKGAFVIAKRHSIPVQPFRITYEPLRRAAYIDDDFFPAHVWQLIKHGPLKARIEFGEPVSVDDPAADAEKLWTWARSMKT